LIPIKERLEAWTAGLRRSGRRVAAPRVKIFRILAESKDHPTAEQVFEHARRRFPTLSRATVCNTLDSLVEAGEAAALRLQTGGGPPGSTAPANGATALSARGAAASRTCMTTDSTV
jgi:hypothetical protein